MTETQENQIENDESGIYMTEILEKPLDKWQSDETNELFAAMLEVQKAMPVAEKAATGQIQSRQYHYADLNECKKAGDPVLTKAGLVCYQRPRPDLGGIETFIIHPKSGQWTRGLVLCEVGDDERGGSHMQQVGSAQHYARRYGYECMVGLSRVEDNDAASTGSKPAAAKTKKFTPSKAKGADSPSPVKECPACLTKLNYSQRHERWECWKSNGGCEATYPDLEGVPVFPSDEGEAPKVTGGEPEAVTAGNVPDSSIPF